MSENTPKTVLVTGGNRGIGYEIAKEFQAAGHNVCITYRSGEAPEEFFAVQADVRDADSINEAFKTIESEFGPVEVLVANAGITRDNLIMKMSEEDFDAVIDANLKGCFNTIKAVSRQMLKQRAGRIINITSVSGILGNAGQANYAASKAGIIGLTKTMARELASRGITVNGIAPGFVDTEMTQVLSDEVKEAATKQIPLGRFGKPEDIANMAAYLASEKAAYMTGQIISVDGGMAI